MIVASAVFRSYNTNFSISFLTVSISLSFDLGDMARKPVLGVCPLVTTVLGAFGSLAAAAVADVSIGLESIGFNIAGILSNLTSPLARVTARNAQSNERLTAYGNFEYF